MFERRRRFGLLRLFRFTSHAYGFTFRRLFQAADAITVRAAIANRNLEFQQRQRTVSEG